MSTKEKIADKFNQLKHSLNQFYSDLENDRKSSIFQIYTKCDEHIVNLEHYMDHIFFKKSPFIFPYTRNLNGLLYECMIISSTKMARQNINNNICYFHMCIYQVMGKILDDDAFLAQYADFNFDPVNPHAPTNNTDIRQFFPVKPETSPTATATPEESKDENLN